MKRLDSRDYREAVTSSSTEIRENHSQHELPQEIVIGGPNTVSMDMALFHYDATPLPLQLQQEDNEKALYSFLFPKSVSSSCKQGIESITTNVTLLETYNSDGDSSIGTIDVLPSTCPSSWEISEGFGEDLFSAI